MDIIPAVFGLPDDLAEGILNSIDPHEKFSDFCDEIGLSPECFSKFENASAFLAAVVETHEELRCLNDGCLLQEFGFERTAASL